MNLNDRAKLKGYKGIEDFISKNINIEVKYAAEKLGASVVGYHVYMKKFKIKPKSKYQINLEARLKDLSCKDIEDYYAKNYKIKSNMDICRELNIDSVTVRAVAKKLGYKDKANRKYVVGTSTKKAIELGFESVEGYINKNNGLKTKSKMSIELDVSMPTIKRYFEKYNILYCKKPRKEDKFTDNYIYESNKTSSVYHGKKRAREKESSFEVQEDPYDTSGMIEPTMRDKYLIQKKADRIYSQELLRGLCR